MTCNPAFCIARLRATIAWITLTIGTALLGTALPAAADGLDTSAEYIAAFFRYVEWRNEDRLAAWNVCIIGTGARAQDDIYTDRTVRNKPFALHYLDADASLSDCQALDLSAVSAAHVAAILKRVRGLPILTVGSGQAFCSSGGQICLHLDEGNGGDSRKFEVNLSNVKASTLTVSARLLTIGAMRTAGGESP